MIEMYCTVAHDIIGSCTPRVRLDLKFQLPGATSMELAPFSAHASCLRRIVVVICVQWPVSGPQVGMRLDLDSESTRTRSPSAA